MTTKTIQESVYNIYQRATDELDMNLSPTDVSWIILTFLEDILMGPIPFDTDENLQMIADEVAKITDDFKVETRD